jgi:DNA-binding GntR family transcriptional regulator
MSADAGRASSQSTAFVLPLARQATSTLVAEQLRWQLFRGELRPGERITPERVAEQFSVSRLPVREALAELARDGLVVLRPHQRAYVDEFDEEVLRDHFEIVGLIQGLAGTRLVERGGRDALDRLDAIVDDMARARSDAEVYELSMMFHRIINVEGGSARHRSVLRSLGRMLPSGMSLEIPGFVAASRSGASGIVAALRSKRANTIRHTFLAVQRTRADLVVAHLVDVGVLPTVRADNSLGGEASPGGDNSLGGDNE